MTQYNKMIKLLDVYKDEEKLVANPLKCIGYLNAAMCELKMKQYQGAKKNCDKALEIEDQNVKGLFRRGQVGTHCISDSNPSVPFCAFLHFAA